MLLPKLLGVASALSLVQIAAASAFDPIFPRDNETSSNKNANNANNANNDNKCYPVTVTKTVTVAGGATTAWRTTTVKTTEVSISTKTLPPVTVTKVSWAPGTTVTKTVGGTTVTSVSTKTVAGGYGTTVTKTLGATVTVTGQASTYVMSSSRPQLAMF